MKRRTRDLTRHYHGRTGSGWRISLLAGAAMAAFTAGILIHDSRDGALQLGGVAAFAENNGTMIGVGSH